MMTETIQNTYEPLILILGIGEDSKKYIDEIKGWNSPLVSSKMLDRDYTGPGGGIEMAILIITENVDATILAKNLKQSMLLTLIVATCEIRAMEGSYDSMARVSADKAMETVRTVAEILNNPPNLICKDFNDLWCVLKGSETFQTFSYTSSLRKGGMINLVNYLKEKLKELPSLEKMLVSINVSSAGLKTLRPEDIKILIEYFSNLPDSIKVVWGLDATDNLASDELTISIIATEPRKTKE